MNSIKVYSNNIYLVTQTVTTETVLIFYTFSKVE